MTTTADLIRIRAAAKYVGRSMNTLRRWCDQGVAPTGDRLHVFREPITRERMIERRDVEKLRASLSPRADG